MGFSNACAESMRNFQLLRADLVEFRDTVLFLGVYVSYDASMRSDWHHFGKSNIKPKLF